MREAMERIHRHRQNNLGDLTVRCMCANRVCDTDRFTVPDHLADTETAIPDDEGIEPGRAAGWVVVLLSRLPRYVRAGHITTTVILC